MIAKGLNLLALLGAVVWLARAPDWEPAVTSIALLATLVGLEVRGRGLLARKPTVDSKLFDEFLREFPSNGKSARFLLDQDIGAPFHQSALREMDRFVDHWNDAEHEFHNKELETKRIALYKHCRDFRVRLSVNIGLVGRSAEFYSLGIDDFEMRPEKLSLQQSLNDEASDVYRAHQELVRAGRRILDTRD